MRTSINKLAICAGLALGLAPVGVAVARCASFPSGVQISVELVEARPVSGGVAYGQVEDSLVQENEVVIPAGSRVVGTRMGSTVHWHRIITGRDYVDLIPVVTTSVPTGSHGWKRGAKVLIPLAGQKMGACL